MTGRLGIVAGEGELPLELIRIARRQGHDVFVVGIEDQANPDDLAPFPHAFFRIPCVGQAIEIMRRQGVTEVVLTGDLQPWHFHTLPHDDWVAERMPAIAKLLSGGENAIVSFVIDEFAKAGIQVISARSFAAGLFPEKGTLGRVEPDTEAWVDIGIGVEAARTLGRLDIGQAVVVQRRVVLAVEGAEGTDRLIRRAGELQEKTGSGAILVKMMKPQQELRADPPTVGPTTVEGCVAAGFRGLAIEAGGALLVNQAEAVRLADAAGLFIVSVAPPEPGRD